MASNLEQALLGDEEKESIPKDWKMIGFYGSPETSDLLSLGGVGLGLDKSKLLRQIVDDWLEKNDPIQIAAEKVKELASHVSEEITEEEFTNKVRSFLVLKRIPEDLIKQVLEASTKKKRKS